jgi:hypothetical protein
VDKRKLMAIAAVPAVLTFGALGFASQQGSAQHYAASPTHMAQQAENTNTDPDNIQQGDHTSPDKPSQAEEQEVRNPDLRARPCLWDFSDGFGTKFAE